MEGGLGCSQHPALPHHQHSKHPRHCHPWVQPGPATSPATPWEHHPTTVHGHRGAPWHPAARSSCRKQAELVARESLRHVGLPATGIGLIGVKPGEFGTAARKSRPAREPRAGSRATGQQPCCSLVAVANSTGSSAASPSGQGPCGWPQSGSCTGAAGGQRGVCTRNSSPAREREARKCKIARCHPGLSNNPPLEGNLAHTSLRPPAKSCWERGFTHGLETPRSF